MTTTGKRDNLFPSASLGRAAGARLSQPNQNTSHESLSAHPLLSPFSPSQSTSPDTQPKYLPYTPRQRPSSSHFVSPTVSAAPGAIVHPSPVSARGAGEVASGSGEATAMGKLQMMNLKAAARDIGLDVGSVGWAILEKLVEECGGCGQSLRNATPSDWCDVWTAVTVGKATLLLPLEHLAPREKITADFVKDHVVYCDGSSRTDSPIITLSGLRGTLNAETLTFRSSIHPSSKVFQSLIPPLTRSSHLYSLPPLPLPPHDALNSPTLFVSQSPHSPLTRPLSSPRPQLVSTAARTTYPIYTLKSHSPALPLPPAYKPPQLPPRPPTTANTSPAGPRPSPSPATTTSSRLSLPFASLFGKSNPSVPIIGPAPAGVNTAAANLNPNSIGADWVSGMSAGTKKDGDHIVEVSAFTVDRRIVRMDVCREVNGMLRDEVQECLHECLKEDEEECGVLEIPSWVVERVREFVERLMPFVKPRSSGSANLNPMAGVFGARSMSSSEKEGVQDGRKGVDDYEVNWALETPEQASERFQDFYATLEQDLRMDESFFGYGGNEGPVEATNGGIGEGRGGEEKDRVIEKRVAERLEGEARIRDVVESVERVICELFYDRLFLQCESDDASHDEALSGRVAALNMLDLGLEHLDVQVPAGRGEDLDAVVRACGETLSQLDAVCRAPADKAAVLVAAHKLVVDGLSKLPPICLKSEEDQKTATISNRAVADIEADGSLLEPASMPIPDTPGVLVSSPPLADPCDSPPSYSPASEMHPKSSPLTMSPPPTEPTPVSGDILLPLIIFSVVKANPPHLVSHLLFTQRFRNQSIGGEESYCLINLMAVAEFLENVDLEALGLGDSENRVMSASELTPIPINRSPKVSDTPSLRQEDSLRGRMEQQVDSIAGSANKVITGVVDSSFGVLRLLLPSHPPDSTLPPVHTGQGAPAVHPGFGLLRRERGFSIASIAASLPGSNRAKSGGEETGQPLVTVSRPGSLRSVAGENDGGEESENESVDGSRYGRDDDAETTGAEEEEEEHDARSIRSFESMMNGRARDRTDKTGTRKSLTDRLAHMSGLARLKSEDQAFKGSMPSHRSAHLVSSGGHSPVTTRLAPPNQRFVECPEGDIRVSEVGELLREYRRVVEGMRAMGGFDESTFG